MLHVKQATVHPGGAPVLCVDEMDLPRALALLVLLNFFFKIRIKYLTDDIGI